MTPPAEFASAPGGSPLRRGQTRSITCWHCGHTYPAPLNAQQSDCPQCGETLSLADVVIMEQRVARVHTQGELRIMKNAFLVAGDSVCGGLRLMGGGFAGRIRASGEAKVESENLDIHGELVCDKLSVARKAKVKFDQPLHCNEADIQGSFQGELICSGSVRLGKDSHLAGHCRARTLNMEPGSVLAASLSLTGSTRSPAAAGTNAATPAKVPVASPLPSASGPYQRQLPESYYRSSLPQPV